MPEQGSVLDVCLAFDSAWLVAMRALPVGCGVLLSLVANDGSLRRQSEPFEMTASALAKASRLTSGAMTNRVDRQVNRGFVSRRHDQKDRRRVLVRLTREGRRLVDRATVARFGAADSMLNTMPTANREKLNGLLRELVLATRSSAAPQQGNN